MKGQIDSKDNFLQHYYLECKTKLADYSVYQLVNSFNRETVSKGWTGTRGAFLRALMDTFIEKGVNTNAVTSSMSDHTSTSFKYPVFLRNGKDGEQMLEQLIVQ
jgi:hypothetical protein